MVSEVAGIQQCFVTCEDEARGVWRLKTDGANLPVCCEHELYAFMYAYTCIRSYLCVYAIKHEETCLLGLMEVYRYIGHQQNIYQ